MFCSKCGKQVEDGDKFCGGCGAQQSVPVQAPGNDSDSEQFTIEEQSASIANHLQITCPHCGYQRQVPTERIPPDEVKVSCPKCHQGFTIGSTQKQVSDFAPNSKISQNTAPDDVHGFYRVFIGDKNFLYYLKKFYQFDKNGSGLKVSWNWPAFLFNSTWALYRKMYGWFFATTGIFIVTGLVENIAMDGIPVLTVIICVVFGIYANSLYHKKALKEIETARIYAVDEDTIRINLAKKGGVHKWVLFILPIIFFVGVISAIAIPQFSAYRMKAYNSAANSDLKNAKVGLEAYFADKPAEAASYPLQINNEIVILSKGVTLLYFPTDSDEAECTSEPCVNYEIYTYHENGNKIFATSASLTQIFYADKKPNDDDIIKIINSGNFKPL